jgi:singapore isolate B (sub-type 7) whole genome shotgun sequence assembly, scaffold_0
MNILNISVRDSITSRIASLPARFMEALQKRDEVVMKECFNHNFDLRREIWGDEALGRPNLQMIEVRMKNGL